MFCFKNNGINLTGAVFLARKHIKESTHELISTHNKLEERVFNLQWKYVQCHLQCGTSIDLEAEYKDLENFLFYWVKHSRAADILIFEGAGCIVVNFYRGNLKSLLWCHSQQVRKFTLVYF